MDPTGGTTPDNVSIEMSSGVDATPRLKKRTLSFREIEMFSEEVGCGARGTVLAAPGASAGVWEARGSGGSRATMKLLGKDDKLSYLQRCFDCATVDAKGPSEILESPREQQRKDTHVQT